MQSTFKPIGNRVLLKRVEDESKSKSGLLLPESAKGKPDKLKVIALGTGNVDEKGVENPFPVSVGDIVMIDKYAGQEIDVENELYVIVRVPEILAVL